VSRVNSELSLRNRPSPTALKEEMAGLTGSSPARTAATLEAAFRWRGLTISLDSQYSGKYKVSDEISLIEAQGGRYVGALFSQDVAVGYEWGAMSASRTTMQVQLGVTNIFNSEPRLDVTQAARSYISIQDDPRMRSFLLSWTLRFSSAETTTGSTRPWHR
jgi:hypothetical protein